MYTRLFAALCALATTANAVTTIEVKGKDFVNSKTGDRFQILGVEYVSVLFLYLLTLYDRLHINDIRSRYLVGKAVVLIIMSYLQLPTRRFFRLHEGQGPS